MEQEEQKGDVNSPWKDIGDERKPDFHKDDFTTQEDQWRFEGEEKDKQGVAYMIRIIKEIQKLLGKDAKFRINQSGKRKECEIVGVDSEKLNAEIRKFVQGINKLINEGVSIPDKYLVK